MSAPPSGPAAPTASAGAQLPYLELSLDLLEVGEAVVVEKPVLQDLVGHGGVRVGQDVLDEAEGVLAQRLDPR